MNIWIVRWRKCSKSCHVYNTQATNFRVFDSKEAAKGFREELRRRIKLRYEADYGISEDINMYSSCCCGDLNNPNGYSVDTKNRVTIEIVCARMNDATLQANDVEVS